MYLICYHIGCGSIGFAIDNTGSGSSVMTIAYGLLDALKSKETEISSWLLTTFNDVDASLGFEAIDPKNVELVTTTDSIDTFRQSMTTITHSGGGDGPERATQGGIWKEIMTLYKNHTQVFSSRCKKCPGTE